MYICDTYKSSLHLYCQKFNSNSQLEFTNEEVLSVYLFCSYFQSHFGINDIHTFVKKYLSSRFPKLPSYQTFNVV